MKKNIDLFDVRNKTSTGLGYFMFVRRNCSFLLRLLEENER